MSDNRILARVYGRGARIVGVPNGTIVEARLYASEALPPRLRTLRALSDVWLGEERRAGVLFEFADGDIRQWEIIEQ